MQSKQFLLPKKKRKKRNDQSFNLPVWFTFTATILTDWFTRLIIYNITILTRRCIQHLRIVLWSAWNDRILCYSVGTTRSEHESVNTHSCNETELFKQKLRQRQIFQYFSYQQCGKKTLTKSHYFINVYLYENFQLISNIWTRTLKRTVLKKCWSGHIFVERLNRNYSCQMLMFGLIFPRNYSIIESENYDGMNLYGALT